MAVYSLFLTIHGLALSLNLVDQPLVNEDWNSLQEN